MKRKNLFLFLSRNNRNYKAGIYMGSSIVILGTVFIVAQNCLTLLQLYHFLRCK
jgi:hypothetical protein